MMLDAAVSISSNVSGESVINAASRFSSSLGSLVVPGIGTIQDFLARIHANAHFQRMWF